MFKNPDIQRAASQNGFAVIDANLDKEIEQLYTYISNHFKLSTTDFYYSLIAQPYETNIKVQDALQSILGAFFDSHFEDYRILNTSFLAKPAETKKEFLLHQDWCYTDEKHYSAYNIWIPLDDVDENNGAMFFLPESQMWFENYRSGSLHSSRITSGARLREHLQTVPLKKGQVLLFNPAVFHGSHPNYTKQNRLVVTSTVLPLEAPFLYFDKKEDEDEVAVFDVDRDTFLRDLERLAFGGKPTSQPVRSLKYSHVPVSESDLIAKLAEHDFANSR